MFVSTVDIQCTCTENDYKMVMIFFANYKNSRILFWGENEIFSNFGLNTPVHYPFRNLGNVNKRHRNLAVNKEPWDLSEVIRDKHRLNKNIPGLGPQKMYCSHVRSAAEMACLSRMTCSWRMRKRNTELAYSVNQFFGMKSKKNWIDCHWAGCTQCPGLIFVPATTAGITEWNSIFCYKINMIRDKVPQHSASFITWIYDNGCYSVCARYPFLS